MPETVDNSERILEYLPQWHGWHAFRRGLATNLHALGVDDKTIQTILRHSHVGLTMNVYVKSVSESQGERDGRVERKTRNLYQSCNEGAGADSVTTLNDCPIR